MAVETIGRTALSRRRLQRLAVALPAPLALTALGGRSAGLALAQDDEDAAATATPFLAPTPECGDEDDFGITPEQTEGPYYTPNTPERTSFLEEGITGTPLTVTGYVYSTDCRPVERALIDFWHADDAGAYDNEGFRLRGHQFTDEDGRYELETILPGIYPGRTRHIHVKVQAPDGPILTSQLYFPNEAENEGDGIYRPELEMDLEDADGDDPEAGTLGVFTFVLDLG